MVKYFHIIRHKGENMKDERVLAYCNLFAVLGAIPKLLELDGDAKKLVENKKISIGFSVKGGPCGKLSFNCGKAEMTEGTKGCSIKLYFPSCKKFNDMIDGKAMPLPLSGFHRLGFLLGPFMKLTDILSSYLRPEPKALESRDFFERSTVLMLHVIAGAVAQIGNTDKIGMFSASNIVDGNIKLGIGEDTAVFVGCRGHELKFLGEGSYDSFSEMKFEDINVARDLFDGTINAVVAVGEGKVRICGMISQIDNVNRILDRVSLYLA